MICKYSTTLVLSLRVSTYFRTFLFSASLSYSGGYPLLSNKKLQEKIAFKAAFQTRGTSKLLPGFKTGYANRIIN
jgi:hypothetical protein